MKLKDRLLFNQETGKKLDYNQWNKDQKIYQLFDLELNEDVEINKKIQKELYISVDPNNKVPIPAEMDDLTRLHFLVLNQLYLLSH